MTAALRSSGQLPAPGAIAKERYLSREFAALERERLWKRVWMHAAPLDLLTEPGRFYTVFVGGHTDVLVVRGQDGKIRAFENVCLHRGRRLVTEQCGKSKALRCPMHHWVYGDDGHLAFAPDREVFGKLLDPTPKLPELACDTWGGHVWVHLGKPEQTLHEWLRPVVDQLAHYDLENYALTELSTVEIACNWKTVADGFNEVYHLQGVHPGLLAVVDETTARQEMHGPHMYATWYFARPSSRLEPTGTINETLRGFLGELGVDARKLDNDLSRVPGAIRASMRSRGINHLSDDELISSHDWYLFPGFAVTAYAHMLHLHSYRPHPTDPERSWFDYFCYKRVFPGEKRPEPQIRQFVRPGTGPSPGPSIEEDMDAFLEVQRGMHSPGFSHLILGTHEARILHMNAMIDEYLGHTP